MKHLLFLLLLLLLVLSATGRVNRKRTAIVADVSASVRANSAGNPERVRSALKLAMRRYLRPKRGHQVALYECASHARQLMDYTSIDDREAADTAIDHMHFELEYDESFTSWEACLRAVVAEELPLVVYFITDGDPTTYLGQPGHPPSDDPVLNMQRAVAAANTLRSNGVTVTPIGVGARVTDRNLEAIAGPCRLGSFCWQGVDYFHVTDFNSLRDGVRDGLVSRDDTQLIDWIKRVAYQRSTGNRWQLALLNGTVIEGNLLRDERVLHDAGDLLRGERHPPQRMGNATLSRRLLRMPGKGGGVIGMRVHLSRRATCMECRDTAWAMSGTCTSMSCGGGPTGAACIACVEQWEDGGETAQFCDTNTRFHDAIACLCDTGVCDVDCYGPCFATDTPTQLPTAEPTPPTTQFPTDSPTPSPTQTPSELPTITPTSLPTQIPGELSTASATFDPTEYPTEVPSASPTDAPSAIPTVYTEEPSTAPTTTTSMTSCVVHVWEDISGDGQQRRSEGSEPNLEGVQVTLIDSEGTVHTATTDSHGNASFDNVAPGPAQVTVTVPLGYTLTTPATNSFTEEVPPGPGPHIVQTIGLRRSGEPVADLREDWANSVTGAEIAAAIIAGFFALLLLAFLIKATCGGVPVHRAYRVKKVTAPAAEKVMSAVPFYDYDDNK